MPRDHKAPLIQRIAKQANVAFKGMRAAAHGGGGGGHAAAVDRLISLVTSVRAADLKIPPRGQKKGGSGGAAGLHGPPVAYMHICETEAFSMGVFLLRPGASIPLHDHPGMDGMLKVLYGKVSVRSFDKLEGGSSEGGSSDSGPSPPFDPPLEPLQGASVWRSVLRSVAQYSEESGPCLLTPLRDNLHQIDAVEGAAAFLDILAPPYNPDDGRDCHYYKVLQTAAEEGTVAKGGQKEKGEEVWLLEIPQPEDFWCGGEPYPGPAVLI